MKPSTVIFILVIVVITRTHAGNVQARPKNGVVLIVRHGEKKVPEDKSDPGA
jgi:hypothetical protein